MAEVAWIVGMVFGFLNCFFGYRLLKMWVTLCGFGLGVGGGLFLGRMFLEKESVIWIVAVIAGLLLAAVAYQVYLVGAFLMGWVLTVLGFFSLGNFMGFSDKGELAILGVGAFAGIAVGALLVKFSRQGIILLTAVNGGFSIAAGIEEWIQPGNSVVMLAIGCVVAAVGVWLQFRMTSVHR